MEQSPLQALDQELQNHPQRRAIQRSIVRLLEIAKGSTDADEWRLINGALADIRDGLSVFAPHRQTRKVTVFGSARTHSEEPAYKLAQELAVEAVARGFEVMTGAGGGIMEAANSGAGCENSTAAEAMQHICHFYRVFHTAQFAEDRMELLLHSEIPTGTVAELNREFDNLVDEGSLSQGESCDSNGILRPCLRFHLDRRRVGLLYQLIDRLNDLPLEVAPAIEQPGERIRSALSCS